jgi:hypothetical protein
MKKAFLIFLLSTASGIVDSAAQAENLFYKHIPKGYVINDFNGTKGPAIEFDFDSDGIKDLATIFFEDQGSMSILCIYLSSTFNATNSFKYCEWMYMKHDMSFDKGVLSVFSDNGSMGQYGSVSFRYDAVKKEMVITSYEDDAGKTSLKMLDWKL